MQRSWKTLLPLVVLVLVIGYLYTQRHATVAPSVAPPPIATPTDQPASDTAPPSAQLPAVLPPEARERIER